MSANLDIAKQFDEHLRSPRQVWLLGAGVSVNAGIPLMYPLTDRVTTLMENGADDPEIPAATILEFIRSELPEDCHIEHILSHLGDMIALAERSKDTSFQVGGERIKKTVLQAVHHKILDHIRDVLRWGYRPKTDAREAEEGNRQSPIVRVEDHRRFVRALYRVGRAGLDSFREPVHFVTINYDTLIEDALSLERVPYADGLTGGAVAFWSEEAFNAAQHDSSRKALVTKLHGSIDWFRSGKEQGQIFRVRHDELYPDRAISDGSVVIYPQSTKYTASRLNPFGCMFQHFRDLLATGRKQVIFICGYSFGDDHINADMAQSILHPESGTTVVAFAREGANGMPQVLDDWRKSSAGQRIFVATDKGLYRGNSDLNFPAPEGERDWWTFQGVTNLLQDGLPTDIVEAIG